MTCFECYVKYSLNQRKIKLHFNILSIGNRLTTNVRKYPVHLHRRINNIVASTRGKHYCKKKTEIFPEYLAKDIEDFEISFRWWTLKKCPHLQTQQS